MAQQIAFFQYFMANKPLDNFPFTMKIKFIKRNTLKHKREFKESENNSKAHQ